MDEARKRKFIERVLQAENKKAINSTLLTRRKFDAIVQNLRNIEESGAKENKDYRLQNRYQLLEIQDNFYLNKKGTEKRFVCSDELFDIIDDAHKTTGHGGRNVTNNELKKKFANISREHIMYFLELCEECQLKKTKVRKSLVVKPIVSNHMNSRRQV